MYKPPHIILGGFLIFHNQNKTQGAEKMNGNLKIFTGNINRPLAKKICAHKSLKTKLGKALVGQFSGKETRIEIQENVRGCDVYVIQPICENMKKGLSPNDALMELLLLIAAAKRSSAKRVTAILPYYGYGRQDRKDKPRVPISAKVIADMITAVGTDRVLAIDLHSNQIQGFFNIPFDHLYSIGVIIKYLKSLGIESVVSPDVGNAKMTSAYAELLKALLGIVDKKRKNDKHTEAEHFIGKVKGKTAIIDDLTATINTLNNAGKEALEAGATKVYGSVVHGILAVDDEVNAIENLDNSCLEELIMTDSVTIQGKPKSKKIKILTVSGLLAKAINHIHMDESVSVMFQGIKVEG